MFSTVCLCGLWSFIKKHPTYIKSTVTVDNAQKKYVWTNVNFNLYGGDWDDYRKQEKLFLNPAIILRIKNAKVFLHTLWQYGLWSFQTGGTKSERFLPKNQHTQIKLLNFEFWINGKLSKRAKIWLSKSIFYVKNHLNLSQLKNTNLGANFLLLTFFDKIDF